MQAILKLTLSCVASILAPVASAAIFTVGSPVGAGQCTHGTIQAAINAANSNPGFDTIRLTRSLTYEPEAVSVTTSQDLNIVGGFANCTQSQTDNIQTTVSGGLTGTSPVFSITANGSAIVKLRHLRITRGQRGGIHFSGNGILQIIETLIDHNNGVGIEGNGTGTDAELVIDTGTLILNNTNPGTFGGGVGGVRLIGTIEMTMTAAQTMIAFNEGGLAGGLFVGALAHAYVGSPGYNGLPAIFGNYGLGVGPMSHGGTGGIHADGTLKLFSTDPARPVRVEDNSAPSVGGIRVGGSDAKLCAWDFVVDRNAGGDGSGIGVDGGMVVLNRNEFTGCARHPQSVACSANVHCNSVSGNLSQAPGGAPTGGAAIQLRGASLVGRRLRMRENLGGHAIHSDNGAFSIDNCLLADNTVSSRLLHAGAGTGGGTGDLYLSNCTLARNAIGAGSVMYAATSLNLHNSIIDQPGRAVQAFDGNPANRNLTYLLLHDLQAAPFHYTLRAGSPRFVAPASGDYHLRSDSPALDFAPAIPSVAYDLDGKPRDVWMTQVASLYGPRDLGAYERQPLVIDGNFDDSTLTHWTRLTGQWDGSQNVAGLPGSGSWSFSGSNLTEPRVELGRQCTRLSEPGRYRLHGWGKGGGNTIPSRDYAVLAWEFRRDGGQGCNGGSADRSGELTLGSGTSWGNPATPATIDVLAQEWGPNSSITITLVAVDGGITFPRSISAWFDAISMNLEGIDTLFADGFD